MAGFIWKIVRDNPRDMGMEPEHSIKEEDKSFASIIKGVKKIAGSLQFWQYFFVVMILVGSVMSLSGLWLIPYMMHVFNFSRDAASSLVVVITLGLLVGSSLLGWMESKIKSRILMLRIVLTFNILFWFYIIVPAGGRPPFQILMLLLFFAGAIGIMAMVSFTSVRNMFPRFKGSVSGVLNIAPFLGTIIFNFLIGWRLDASWTGEIMDGSRVYSLTGYRQGFSVILILLLAALAVSFNIKEGEEQGQQP